MRVLRATAVATLVLLVIWLAGRAAPWRAPHTSTLTGWIALPAGALYTFSAPSDSRAAVAIDGQTVLGAPEAGPAPVAGGVHAIYVGRTARGSSGPPRVMVRRDGAAASALESQLIFEHKPSGALLGVARGYVVLLAAAEWLWVLSLVAAGAAMLVAIVRAARRGLEREGVWRPLRWVLLGSLALNAVPMWWGLPAIWPPDELMVGTVLGGLAQRFSHGWFDRWPPFHYYTLTAAMSPVLLLNAMGRIDFTSDGWSSLLVLITRSVSVCEAGGTVAIVGVIGARVFGVRAGVFAAVSYGLAAPFLYYAKTANLDVPYIFWFSLAFLACVRYTATLARRDAVVFGAAAALSVCTKDQAYALFPLISLVIAVCTWRGLRMTGHPGWRVLVDARLWAGTLTAVVIFAACHNLLLNWNGFVEHVRYITGPGNENYRVFPATPAGRASLLRLTGHLIEMSWGWPITMIAAAGVFVAMAARDTRRQGLLVLAPAVSYYLTFIDVVLYDYDRFVLPICLVLALFAGLAFDRFLGSARRSGWRSGVVGVVFVYTFLYSATVDVLMLHDSRAVVTAWAHEHVTAGEMLAISGPRELEPSFDRPWLDIPTLADLARHQPAYYVVSADYARAAPPDGEWGALIAALQQGRAGYTLVARVRCRPPWPWLPGAHPELTGPRPFDPALGVVSILRDVNPTLEIYARGAHPPISLPCSQPDTGPE